MADEFTTFQRAREAACVCGSKRFGILIRGREVLLRCCNCKNFAAVQVENSGDLLFKQVDVWDIRRGGGYG